jgi:hypothetical protein
MGGRRKRGTNAREGRTIKLPLCLIDDISLYQVDRLEGMMSSMTKVLGRGGGEGKAYVNDPLKQMDNDGSAIASDVHALCTLHDDNHLPIIDCDLVLEHIFGAEGIKDCNIETSTYLALCDTGIVHYHVGQFGNGRIKGRLVGYIPLVSDNLADVNISLGVAREMARLQANVVLLHGELRDVNYDCLLESAITFLNEMERQGGDIFCCVMDMITHVKRMVEGGYGEVEPWDVRYYTSLVKAQRQILHWKKGDAGVTTGADKDGDNFDVLSQFTGYFTIENSIKGMKVLVSVLFSIAKREVNILIKGQWDVDNVASNATSLLLAGESDGGRGSLRKFIFQHEVDSIIEMMYFNLHPRKGKLCANRSISLLSMFSNYSSMTGNGGGGTKLLFIMEEEYHEDEDGDEVSHATSKKGAATMGGLVMK